MRTKIHLEKMAEIFNPNISQPKQYKETLLNFCTSMSSFIKNEKNITNMIISVICSFIKDYYEEKSKIYRIGKDLFEDLKKVGMDIDVSYIGHTYGKSFCIEFPDYYVVQQHFFNVSFVIFSKTSMGDPSAAIVFGSQNQDGSLSDNYRILCIPIKNGKVEDLVKEIPGYNENEIPMDLIKMTLKSLLYINSGEPDLQKESYKFESKSKDKLRKKMKRFSPFSIVNVGFNYKKRKFNVDYSMVRTHLRWQSYGPERAFIKLIWVKEHQRNYKEKESKCQHLKS